MKKIKRRIRDEKPLYIYQKRISVMQWERIINTLIASLVRSSGEAHV